MVFRRVQRLLCASVLGGVFLFSGHVFATETNSWYGSGALGLSVTRDADWSETGLSGDIEIDRTANFAGALGVKVSPNVRAEVEVSYRNADLDRVTVDGVGSAALSGESSVWGFLLNGYYDFMPEAKVSPFITGGIGLARHNAEITAVGGLGVTGADGTDTVFAYQAGGGLNFNVSDKTALWAGYRYFGTSDPDLDGADFSYGSHELRVGVRQEF